MYKSALDIKRDLVDIKRDLVDIKRDIVDIKRDLLTLAYLRSTKYLGKRDVISYRSKETYSTRRA